jgi:hypothetical protein
MGAALRREIKRQTGSMDSYHHKQLAGWVNAHTDTDALLFTLLGGFITTGHIPD